VSGRRRRPAASCTLRQGRTSSLDMPGASAVAAYRGALYLAEDDEGIYRHARGRCTLWAGRDLHAGLADLEGLAVDAATGTLWAVAEERGEVIALPLAGRTRTARVIGRLPRPGTRRNKGFEGLAFAPAAVSPTRRDALVAVHEGKPRRVGVFALPGLGQTHDLRLPAAAKDALADLADVAVDPVTGLLVLLSEESRRLAVCDVEGDELVLRALTDVRTRDGARPEGVTFATPSRLLVVTEGPATLVTFAVARS
jgi:uncharacterized protein YjiK